MITLPLSRGLVAVIDDEDAHLTAFKWHAVVPQSGIAYAARNVPGDRRKQVFLHREVLGLQPGDPLVDHRDGDGLNCRRANLRLSSRSTNAINVIGKNRANKSSPYLGVSFHKVAKKWMAQIQIDGRSLYLGLHDTAEDANHARLAAEKRHHGIQPQRAAAHGDHP